MVNPSMVRRIAAVSTLVVAATALSSRQRLKAGITRVGQLGFDCCLIVATGSWLWSAAQAAISRADHAADASDAASTARGAVGPSFARELLHRGVAKHRGWRGLPPPATLDAATPTRIQLQQILRGRLSVKARLQLLAALLARTSRRAGVPTLPELVGVNNMRTTDVVGGGILATLVLSFTFRWVDRRVARLR